MNLVPVLWFLAGAAFCIGILAGAIALACVIFSSTRRDLSTPLPPCVRERYSLDDET